MQYRTEIYVADDRYVCLQLPDYIPPGRATVVVYVVPADEPPAEADPEDHRPEAEGDDFEWWEEFDADADADADAEPRAH